MKTKAWKQKILKSLSFHSEDKISIFINKKQDLDKVASILKGVYENSRAKFRLTSFDVELPASFYDLNVKIEHSSDYLTKKDYLDIDNFFFKKLARGWMLFKNPVQKYLNEYKRGILNRCTEDNFVTSNLLLNKYIEVIDKIFMKYKPTKILIVEDKYFLLDIVKLFQRGHKFKVLRINPESNPLLKKIKILRKKIKVFFVDSTILLIDFFVLHWVFLSKKFENRIVIDYRLYKKFARTKLREQLLICPFEKGLKIRLQMLAKGLLYLPLRTPSCLNFLQPLGTFRIKKDWNKIRHRPDFKNTFKYKDTIFWGAMEKYISQMFLVVFPRVVANMGLFQKFAREKKAKLIVMRNDIKELERTVIEAARPLKIPSLVIQHGIAGDVNYGNTVHADMTAVWGNASIGWFKQFGYQNNRFTVTGNPMHDELYHRVCANQQHIRKKVVCRKLNLILTKKIITFLTESKDLFITSSIQGNEMVMAVRAIVNALKSFPDVQLIIKLHPYDVYLDDYRNIIKNFNLNSNIAVVREFNTFDILEASDLVITTYSSCGLEALILNKPLVAFRLDRAFNNIIVPYAERGVAIGVKKTEKIESAIKNGLYNKAVRENLNLKRKEFVFNYAYKMDGQATKRIEQLMYKLANNRIINKTNKEL